MRRVGFLLVIALCAPLLAACSEDEPVHRDVVAFLLAGRPGERWTTIDEPFVGERVRFDCGECHYLTRTADGNPDTQQRQLEEVLDAGADVIVLDPTSTDAGEELAELAGDTPVISYDRVVAGADYAVGIDDGAAAAAVAEAVVDTIPAKGRVLLVNGPAGEGVRFKDGIHQVLDGSGLEVVEEYDATSPDPEEVTTWVAQQLATTPAAELDAVITSSDAQAAGAATALTDAGVPVADWPLITGDGGDLAALRRIVLGEQGITVYRPYVDEAWAAGHLAATLAQGQEPEGLVEHEGIPALLFDPTVVTVDNLTSTFVRDRMFRIYQICDAATAPRCAALGLQ